MGTRADFYIGRGQDAEWLGSIAWDGYPSGIGNDLLEATSLDEFKSRLAAYWSARKDLTRPNDGWPWPWSDSSGTDYAYAFDGGKVWASCFGTEWFEASNPEPEEHQDAKSAVFPNMESRKRVTLGRRSGLIVLGGS